MYLLQVTVTLKLDHVFRIFISGAYLLLFVVGIPNVVCECFLIWRIVPFHFSVTVTLTSDLVFSIGIKSRAYFLCGRNSKGVPALRG